MGEVSPNIPTLASATVYPGTCFIEGFVNVSEGRGTVHPFEWIGAPWIDGKAFTQRLEALELPGVTFRACEFTPKSSKNAGKLCTGIEVSVNDRLVFDSVATGLYIVEAIVDMYPAQATWAYKGSHFDRLIGTDKVRYLLESGEPASHIIKSWAPEINEFRDIRDKYLLYRLP